MTETLFYNHQQNVQKMSGNHGVLIVKLAAALSHTWKCSLEDRIVTS